MKPIQVDESKAKRLLAVLMRRAHHGQEIIITRDSQPVAKLVAARCKSPHDHRIGSGGKRISSPR